MQEGTHKETLSATLLIETAGELLSELGENPEYDRALIELTTLTLGYSTNKIPYITELLVDVKERSN